MVCGGILSSGLSGNDFGSRLDLETLSGASLFRQVSKQGGKESDDGGQEDIHKHVASQWPNTCLWNPEWAPASTWRMRLVGGLGGWAVTARSFVSRRKWETEWRVTAAHCSGGHSWIPIKSKTKVAPPPSPPPAVSPHLTWSSAPFWLIQGLDGNGFKNMKTNGGESLANEAWNPLVFSKWRVCIHICK